MLVNHFQIISENLKTITNTQSNYNTFDHFLLNNAFDIIVSIN